MSVKVTKKDVFVTVTVLIIAFGVIPLILYLSSQAKINAWKQSTEESAETVLKDDFQNVQGILAGEITRGFVDNENIPKSKTWEKVNYLNTQSAVSSICDSVTDRLEKEVPDSRIRDYNCYFLIEYPHGIASADADRFTKSHWSKEELLAEFGDSPEVGEISFGARDRTIIPQVLVSVDPLIVFKHTIQSSD